MPKSRVLFIGGTGLISSACTELAAASGFDLYLLNRGKRNVERAFSIPASVNAIHGDIGDRPTMRRAIIEAMGGKQFDSVVQFIAYDLPTVQADVEMFRGNCGQYIFISTASAYQRPPRHYIVTEETPLENPHWLYARNKIACENYLREQITGGFPATIVRPSLTYGQWSLPLAFRSTSHPWTVPDRMLRGKPIIVPGDGSALWVCTHNTDFAKGLIGLLANPQAVGQAFHITSDEVLTWDQIYQTVGRALDVQPKLLHVSSDLIEAFSDLYVGHLRGDKSHSVIFDNRKIKTYVPGYHATMPLDRGVRQMVDWFRHDTSRQIVDEKFNALSDAIARTQAAAFDQAAAWRGQA